MIPKPTERLPFEIKTDVQPRCTFSQRWTTGLQSSTQRTRFSDRVQNSKIVRQLNALLRRYYTPYEAPDRMFPSYWAQHRDEEDAVSAKPSLALVKHARGHISGICRLIDAKFWHDLPVLETLRGWLTLVGKVD